MPESPGKDSDSIPVDNSPEENGCVPEKPSFTSPSSSTRNVSESPIEENLTPAATPTTVDNGVTQVKYRWSFSSSKRSFGSTNEAFFDSHQWLQSDSEDDFFSVNGEFTPSRGNTPKCSFSDRHPRFHNPLFEEEKPRVLFSQSPAPRRKKLAELFRESMREQRQVIFEESLESQSEESKKSSGDNSGELNVIESPEMDKSLNNNHHRCLPRLSAFKESLMEKKKKKKKIHMT